MITLRNLARPQNCGRCRRYLRRGRLPWDTSRPGPLCTSCVQDLGLADAVLTLEAVDATAHLVHEPGLLSAPTRTALHTVRLAALAWVGSVSARPTEGGPEHG